MCLIPMESCWLNLGLEANHLGLGLGKNWAEPTRKVTKRQENTEWPENGKCLCIFDVDRTLTSRLGMDQWDPTPRRPIGNPKLWLRSYQVAGAL